MLRRIRELSYNMNFIHFTSDTFSDCIRLSCARFLDDPDCPKTLCGIPACWIDTMNALLPKPDGMCVYDIFHTILPAGMCNAVTGYKILRKLRQTMRTETEISYTIGEPLRKVFAGLRRCPTVSESTSTLVIALPDKGGQTSVQPLLSMLAEHGFDFSASPAPVLTAITEKFPGSAVFHFSVQPVCRLTVYGRDCREFGGVLAENADETSVPVFRTGLLSSDL